MTITQLTELLGWAVLINLAYLSLASIAVVFFKEAITSIHSKMFDLEEKQLAPVYLSFLSQYKVMTLVFFVASYLALTIMWH